MFRGATSAPDRVDAYKAKIRAFSGTGSPPDYTPSVIQHKLDMMYRKVQQAFGGQFPYQNAAFVLLGPAGIGVGVRVPVGNGVRS
jgi:hypothetical protein